MTSVVAMPERLSGVKFENHDFSSMDFRGADLNNSRFTNCSFDNADMTEAKCEDSSFVCCTFRQTNCYRTNFRNAKLAGSVFEPKDCYGMTISLTCDTFRGVQTSTLWWMAWLIFLSQMTPEKSNKENLKDKLIAMIGAERFVRLTTMFGRRNL